MKIANVALRGMNEYGTKFRDWLEDRRPDIVTLQNTGLKKEFPKEALRDVGYESRFVGNRSGQYPTGVCRAEPPRPGSTEGALPRIAG